MARLRLVVSTRVSPSQHLTPTHDGRRVAYVLGAVRSGAASSLKLNVAPR
ncbi:hypothetical protein SAMN05216550_114205 [Paraburkholderia tropica]|uniref:Uncharacterized protein n=1 Tax=Paraburkholderia tropica TaxID=92647 RepID=A0AAQ1GJN3_9BURK|nr:hypothetical protein SAMN05216550_114205 [Paraburkholderia tropica]